MSSSHAIFANICLAAQKKDKATIQKIINEEASIDIRSGMKTPAEYLAEQGKHAAVDLLINSFGANINYAARGYAYAGYENEVNKLHRLGAVEAFIVTGYAKANNSEAIKPYYLNKKGKERKELLNAEAWGYAFNGNSEKLSSVLEAGADAKPVVIGIAENENLFEFKLESIPYISKRQLYSSFVGVTAVCGYEQRVNSVLESLKKDESFEFYKSLAIAGYLNGGFEAEAARLGDISNSDKVIALAQNGYYKKVNELISNANEKNISIFALIGYMFGGDLQNIQQYYHSNLQSLNSFKYLRELLKIGYVLARYEREKGLIPNDFKTSGVFENYQNLIRSLTFLNDAGSRDFILGAAKLNENLMISKKTLKKDRILSELRQKFDLNYSQLLAWQSLTNRTWLLEGLPALKKQGIPLDILKVITTYVMDINEQEVISLRNALLVSHAKLLISNHLKKMSYFDTHYYQAKNLLKNLEKINQVPELIALIEANWGQTPQGSDPKTPQITKSIFSIFKKKNDDKQDSFYQHLERASQRIKKLM